MTKYIDAEKLKAEIEKRKTKAEAERVLYPKTILSAKNFLLINDYVELLSFIDSLQQEQLDIDKIKREWYNKGYLEGRKNAHIPARELGLPKSLDFQKEQSEVDLEEKIDRMWNPHFNLGGQFVGKPHASVNISARALGKRKTAYGYNWQYV